MGFFRFRRSIKLFPGVRWNFGKKSSSLSFGVRGAHYTVGTRGSRTTVGIPGTGLSYTNIGGTGKRQAHAEATSELDEWASHQKKTVNFTLPDREPDEKDATARQLDTIRSLPVHSDEAVLARLGQHQAAALIEQIKAESEKFTQEKVQEYLRKKRGMGCLSYVGIGFIALLVISNLTERSQNSTLGKPAEATPPPPRATPTPTPASIATPSPIPNKGSVITQQSPTPAALDDAAAQRHAIARFPSLGTANSPLNAEFVRKYRLYRQNRPTYFQNPEWPMQLAEESANTLNSQKR
jgi:hypothetical protein